MSEVKDAAPKVKPAVDALATILESGATIGESLSPIFASDAYEANLPPDLGVTMAQVIALHKYDNNFLAASGLAFGRLSNKQMVDNPTLERTEAEIKIGADKVDLAYLRQREVSDGNGGRKIQYGATVIKYRKTVHLNAVKATLNQLAADTLAK